MVEELFQENEATKALPAADLTRIRAVLTPEATWRAHLGDPVIPGLDLTQIRDVLVQLTHDTTLRAYLGDLAIEQVANLLGLEAPVARRLLVSDPPGSAFLRDPMDPTRDALDVFLDPDFINPSFPIRPPALGGLLPPTTPTDAPGPQTPARPTASETAATLIVRLHKAALLISRLTIPTAELAWLAKPQSDSNGMIALEFDGLPVAQTRGMANLFEPWKAMVSLYRLRDRARGMKALLAQYVEAVGPLCQCR